ncbi:MAG: hypothetical protein RL159_607 [Actinomycetota bacterium]
MRAVFRHLLRTFSSPRPAVSGEGADIRRGEAKGSKRGAGDGDRTRAS